MTDETTFNLDEIDYAGIEPSSDMEFRSYKPGTFTLKIVEVKLSIDDQGRKNARVRCDLVEGQNPEIILKDGDEAVDPASLKPGAVFERFWFHKKEALPIFARFIDKMGLSWESYKAASDKNAFMKSLEGLVFKAVVGYNEQYSKNEIKRYLGRV